MLTADEVHLVMEDIQRLVKAGRVVEAGWRATSAHILDDASDGEIQVMRLMYFNGAQHMFSIMMRALDRPDCDRRVQRIEQELEAFIKEANERADGIRQQNRKTTN